MSPYGATAWRWRRSQHAVIERFACGTLDGMEISDQTVCPRMPSPGQALVARGSFARPLIAKNKKIRRVRRAGLLALTAFVREPDATRLIVILQNLGIVLHLMDTG